jgi:hypothetical protein
MQGQAPYKNKTQDFQHKPQHKQKQEEYKGPRTIIMKNRPKVKPAPKLTRAVFKYAESGLEVDLGLFTRKEEGLAWNRVSQILPRTTEGNLPYGKIEFVPAFQNQNSKVVIFNESSEASNKAISNESVLGGVSSVKG